MLLQDDLTTLARTQGGVDYFGVADLTIARDFIQHPMKRSVMGIKLDRSDLTDDLRIRQNAPHARSSNQRSP